MFIFWPIILNYKINSIFKLVILVGLLAKFITMDIQPIVCNLPFYSSWKKEIIYFENVAESNMKLI